MGQEPQAQIIIGPDGRVLAAAGPLPPGLVDAPLADCPGLSPDIRRAGQALLDELRHSRIRVVTRAVAFEGGDGTLQLIALEAIPIRRFATDVRALLAAKLAVISSQADDVHVALKVEIADDLPVALELDSEKIAWAVTTLVGNALRYLRPESRQTRGGTVTVRARFDSALSRLLLEVQDDGPGVAGETIARLFKRNVLNARNPGLALLLMSDVCAAHGGTIDVHSSVHAADHGTTVRMTFSARQIGAGAWPGGR